jgi:phenylacetate-CoA ligase
MQGQLDDPPYGPILAAPRESAIRYHLTSGTTGRTPIRVLDSMKDWEWITEMWCYAFWGFGVRPSDTVFFAFSYGTFVGFWGAHYACEKIGCLVLPGGNMTTEARVKQIFDMDATVVCSTPTYALRMAQEARNLGIDLVNGPVKRIILSGEPAGSIPATKRLIEEQWGAKAGDTAGMTELGTIMMFECEHQPGGAHIIEDHYIEEVIDPFSGEPVGYGEEGERVVTSFGRGFIPVLRYRTRDLVLKVPASTCSCGRTFDVYDGGIRGRVDDMKLVRGTNVYPRAVEAIVREHEAVDEFQIHLYTAEGIRDEIEVLVEIPDPGADASAIVAELGKALAEAHEGLRFDVKIVENETLPRFELKAKRVLDEREIAGGAGERKQA